MPTNITQVWDSITSSWANVATVAPTAAILKEVVITTPGISYIVRKAPANSGEYELPANVSAIHVLLVGGGGGGSRGASRVTCSVTTCICGGSYTLGAGGGAGEVVEKIIDMSSVSYLTVTVGAGGAGQTTSSATGNHSDGSPTTLVTNSLSAPIGTVTALGGGRAAWAYVPSGLTVVALSVVGVPGGSSGGLAIVGSVSGCTTIPNYATGGSGAGGSNLAFSNAFAYATASVPYTYPRSTASTGLGHSTFAPDALGWGSPQGGQGVAIFGRALAGGGPGVNNSGTVSQTSQFGAPNSLQYGNETTGGNATANTGSGGGGGDSAGGNGGSGICVIRYYG
jgi:hypothetical protein